MNLHSNKLTTLPDSIGNLASLIFLGLRGNQLTTIPDSIGYLASLLELYLDKNQLTTIPNSLFISGRTIVLDENLTTSTEVERLNQLAHQSGVKLAVSIYDPSPVVPQQKNPVIPSILQDCQNKVERNELLDFLRSLEKGFVRFLLKCPETAGWKKDEGASMSKSLYNLINKMREDECLKQRCLVIAIDAPVTCADRVALAYVNMLLASNITQKQLSEMSEGEFFEYAKQDTVIGFLGKKADDKIETLRQRGGALDEIEVRLAYLQAAPILGVTLRDSEMLYQRCSNVNDDELSAVVYEFNSCAQDLDPETALIRRIAEHIYEGKDLRKFGDIEDVIKKSLIVMMLIQISIPLA
ncbi:MAG: hypothetical protein KGQ36_04545 [Rickettsiales bacterium]|nr:hypothetical protein [Rickettsiales bacterium]